jgi:hypothetical protein
MPKFKVQIKSKAQMPKGLRFGFGIWILEFFLAFAANCRLSPG